MGIDAVGVRHRGRNLVLSVDRIADRSGERSAVGLTGPETARQIFKREGDVFITRNPGAIGC